MSASSPPDTDPDSEPTRYDQQFFLELAAKGKDAWNAWRRDPTNKDVRVTFTGVDFAQPPGDQIDFSGFDFGDLADFSRCRWSSTRARFYGASFGNWANFARTCFGHRADFTDACFGHETYFESAEFHEVTYFKRTRFGDGGHFNNINCRGYICFDRATFGKGTEFNSAFFTGNVSFIGTSFGDFIYFDEAVFKAEVNFTALT